ncbi:MAG: ABC transporter substrate-binding protein [Proteobacteria bacterium]|nr:ABC transporter substrate-binding protein [Pseudomonadota bacterium]
MRRREFIALAGGAAAAWPRAVRAQQSAVPVIGFLSSRSPGDSPPLLAAFRHGLGDTDYVEGKTVAIEFRWAEDQYDRLPALAADLVRRQVSVIVATGGPAPIIAAMAATKTIPIVFTSGRDPVELGFVASLSRPGANATGVTLFTGELTIKRMELLRELVPKASTIAFLVNPATRGSESSTRDAQAAARSLGLQVYVVAASSERDLDAVFATLVQQQAVSLVVAADPFLESRRTQLAALAAHHAIPAIYQWRENVVAGGLISYGPRLTDMYRQAGVYTGRILKGAKSTDLPVMQPARFELVINLKTAEALGLTIPPTLLARADEVIE